MTQGAYQPAPSSPGTDLLGPESSTTASDGEFVELVNALSHDLRSPLTLVTGVLQTLTRPELAPQDPDLAHLLRSAVDGAGTMRRLLDDFIAAAAAISGDTATRPRAVDPGSELQRFLAEDPRLAPSVKVRSAGPAPAVVVDPDLLCRIVAGLARGALKRGAERITVDLAIGTGRLVIVLLGDDSGLPPETARRLTVGGSGAVRGLSLSEQLAAGLIRLAGGTLGAVPVPGGGTSIRVVLPAGRSPVSEPPPPDAG